MRGIIIIIGRGGARKARRERSPQPRAAQHLPSRLPRHRRKQLTALPTAPPRRRERPPRRRERSRRAVLRPPTRRKSERLRGSVLRGPLGSCRPAAAAAAGAEARARARARRASPRATASTPGGRIMLSPSSRKPIAARSGTPCAATIRCLTASLDVLTRLRRDGAGVRGDGGPPLITSTSLDYAPELGVGGRCDDVVHQLEHRAQRRPRGGRRVAPQHVRDRSVARGLVDAGGGGVLLHERAQRGRVGAFESADLNRVHT